MILYRIITIFAMLFICQAVNATDKVLAIPIHQAAGVVQSSGMIEKELPKSLAYLSPKIVGGSTAGRSEFPEFAQIFVDGLDGFVYSACGATLLSNKKILTAAHCTVGLGASRFFVLPTFYSFNDNFSFSDMIPVSSKKEHPEYRQSNQFDNDVAILTLSRKSNTPTAKIFAGEDQLTDYSATVIGTGVTAETSTNSPATLRKVSIPVITNELCKRVYGDSYITGSMLCAGLKTGGKSSCQGDSGGPLWVNFNDEKVQAGIVSWGNGCARPDFYGVYARTSTLVEFILKQAPDTKIVVDKPKPIVPFLELLLLDSGDVKFFNNVKATQISTGNEHSCAVLRTGHVMCWGDNYHGQLGNGTTIDNEKPAVVKALNNVAEVSAGYKHTCARLISGQVMCWGDNEHGQLGNGTTTDSTTPVMVSGINTATAIATGNFLHSCASLSNGQVTCWGTSRGGLGNGTTSKNEVPVLVGGINDATDIAVGGGHSCALLSSGQLKCWGRNLEGQLGNGTTTASFTPVMVNGIDNATTIAATGDNTCAGVSSGHVMCWGLNFYGNIGDGTKTNRSSPVITNGISTATTVAVGRFNSCASLSTGEVMCWGENYLGQLGNGTTTDSKLPVFVNGLTNATDVAIKLSHGCAVLSSGQVMCWGGNHSDQLGGNPGPLIYSTTPIKALLP